MIIPELLSILHLCDLVSDSLDEVVVARDLRSDNGELLPVVANQDRQHGCNLMLQTGSQLQLKTRLGLH